MTDDQITELSRLRDNGLTPKQIAKALGLRPTDVSEQIRQLATALEVGRRERGELDPLLECLIDEASAQWLLQGNQDIDEDLAGLAIVHVTRQARGKLVMGTFLVDYWCLGVKNAVGPVRFDRHEYNQRVETSYVAHDGEYRRIPLEQAQAVVLGALEYAAALGFEPHPDCSAPLAMFGPRPEMLLPVEFGRDGKPFFINGPDDDYGAIVEKLTKAVGVGNFGSAVIMESPDDWDD